MNCQVNPSGTTYGKYSGLESNTPSHQGSISVVHPTQTSSFASDNACSR